MIRQATKDQYERETEEADRLVRPAPKIKPPRRDKRREEVRVDQDPDVEGDVDVAKDPDLSLNFKSIGGSVARSILARFQRESREWGSEEGRNEYLKNHPEADPNKHTVKEHEEGKAEEEPEEKGEAKEDEEKPKAKKTPEELAAAGKEVLELAKADETLKKLLDSLGDPAGMGAVVKSTPEMKLDIMPQLKGKKLPDGVKTLGDLADSIAAAKPAPGEKPKGKGKAPTAPGDTEKGQVWVKHKETGRVLQVKPEVLDENPDKYEATKPKPGEHEEIADKPEELAKKVVEKFKSEKKDEDLAWLAHVDEMPTTTKGEDGKPLFYDKKLKKSVPFDKLPDVKKSELIEAYEKTVADAKSVDDLQTKLKGDDKAREAVEGILEPDSALNKKLKKLTKEQGLSADDLPIEKHLPELKGLLPEGVTSVGDLQRLVQGHPDVFRKVKPIDTWEKAKGPESEAFQAFAERRLDAEKDPKSGQLMFSKGDEKVPWDKLDDKEKAEHFQQFQDKGRSDQWTDEIDELSRKNVDLQQALRQLGNPAADVAGRLSETTNLQDPKVLKLLPALQDVTLPPDMTFGDLVKISKENYQPIPPPQRQPAPPRERKLITEGFHSTFKDVSPNLAAIVESSNYHPDDLRQIGRDFYALKRERLKPEDIETRIKEAQKAGLYVTDPDKVVPPKSGLSKSGRKTSWNALDDEEKAVAYAQHRNSVVAHSFALRAQVEAAYTEMGLPPNVASTLAASKLSKRPGESPKERAERSVQFAQQTFNSMLDSNAPPKNYSPEEVEKALKAAGDDPLAKNLVVAHFQANDYLKARDKYLTTKGPNQLDERDSPRHLAARLRDVSEELRRADKQYPPEYRHQNTSSMFRQRFITGMHAKWPDRAAKLEPEIAKMDADDWDIQKAHFDKQNEEFKKAHKKYQQAAEKARQEFVRELGKVQDHTPGLPFRTMPVVKSVRQRLAEANIQEPIPPPALPDKPMTYDQVRNSPRSMAQKGKALWNRLKSGLPGKSASEPTLSERIVLRFLAFSSCEPGETMGLPSSKTAAVTKTGLYWGVGQPSEKAVNVPYVPWQQLHARDFGDKDAKGLLAAAREWLKVPVLSRVLDVEKSLGAVHDIQLRAALDLAIRDHEGGKYSVGLHPAIYNDLLAQLAGKPSASPLLTQREASGSLYTPAPGEDSHMNAASKIRKFAAEIAPQNPGLAFDLTNLAFEVQAEQAKTAGQMPEAFKEHIKEKKEESQGQGQQQQDKEASVKWAALKSSIIRTAAQNPAVRPALIPVLQMIKQQGG